MNDEQQDAESIGSQIDGLRRSMSIETKPGAVVRFSGVGGSRSNIEDACEVLELGQVYVVHSVDVGAWSSTVKLAEGSFNTAMFENT